MSCIPKTEKLIDLIDSFRNGELLLPDFQRKYTWKPKDDMRALLASFILDYPIGTFLIGEAESTSFRAREPECFDSEKYIKKVTKNFHLNEKGTLSDNIESSNGYPAYFLYDGQQRMTTIEMLFGDGFFSSPLDKKNRPRWFLNLMKFGLKDLRWPDDLYDISFDDLCSDEQGDSYIVCIEYNKNSSKASALHPSNREEKILVDYCINDNENGYLFPLDSLFDDSIDVIKTNILSMSVNDILTKTERYKDLKLKNYSEDDFEFECEDIKKEIKKWIAQFSKLLNRIRDYQVPVIRIKSDSLARVAGIFEVVNKQGVDLKTFDLLLARSIKPNEETIRDTLQRVITDSYQCIDGWDIENLFVNSSMKNYKWDPGQFFGGAKDKLNKGEVLTNKLTSLYPKLLCLLSRYSLLSDLQEKTPNSSFKNSNYTWSISEKEMLKTDREDICKVQLDAATRLIRASIYLQVFCGVSKFSELAYQQIILVLALVLDDSNWNKLQKDPRCIEGRRIQAWYWTSIFSGYYKRSQDIMVLKDCLDIRDYVVSGGDFIDERSELIFKDLGYSDEKTLKNTNNKALTLFISQLEIKNGIKDFYSKQADSGEYSRKLISSFDNDIEKDHIISLSYFKKISDISNLDRKSEHMINSPLNKTNISSSANKRKGELSPLDYYKLDKVKENLTGDEAKLLKEHLINPDFILNLDDSKVCDILDKIVSSRFSRVVESVEEIIEQAS
ncbi:DUF262 domain-containing protein [Photobacterium angustum]|uniref:DUF262 domain-containing protein n=1 Tax=Photobacterium angustum TaxID=661 RepID=UPI003D0E98CC